MVCRTAYYSRVLCDVVVFICKYINVPSTGGVYGSSITILIGFIRPLLDTGRRCVSYGFWRPSRSLASGC